jgi:hypothetical protein
VILSIMTFSSLIVSTAFLTSLQTVSQSIPKLYQWLWNGANKSKAILFNLLHLLLLFCILFLSLCQYHSTMPQALLQYLIISASVNKTLLLSHPCSISHFCTSHSSITCPSLAA